VLERRLMALVDNVKKVLRVSHSDMNDEVQGLIEACKKDLEIKGLATEKIVEDDPSIVQAIYLYCKANFGYNNPEAIRFSEAYENLALSLARCGDYRVVE